jgi:hypothetical protein
MSAIATAIVSSAFIGSKAAKSGASTQAAAARDAAELANEQFQQTRQDQAPFREGGLTAQNRLMTLLGLAPSEAPRGGGGAGVAGMVAGAVQDAMGQPQGSSLQVDKTSPDFGRYARDFGMADFVTDPGYNFRFTEGQKALDRQAAARGGLISGSALKAASRYGQDMASQEFTNAFNRYQTNRSNQLNPLQSLMGAGQTATNFLGATGAANAANVGNLMTGGAAAQAAGQMGAANAIGQGVGQYLNYTSNNNLLDTLRNRGSTYNYTPTTNYSTGADYTLSGKLGSGYP